MNLKTPEPNYHCVIVDDNEIDRLSTVSRVRRFPFLQLAGVFSDPIAALEFLKTHEVSVLFLDIDMPGMTGLDLRNKLMHIPVCVFVTSYPDFAVQSFDAAALDFLVKPYSLERFTNTIDRIKNYLEIKQKSILFEYSLGHDIIYIKQGKENIKIKLHDVLYLEALKDYSNLVTPEKKYCVLGSLGNLLLEENFKSFVRIHRSYAVQKNYINKVDAHNVYVNKHILPLGKSFKENIESLM